MMNLYLVLTEWSFGGKKKIFNQLIDAIIYGKSLNEITEIIEITIEDGSCYMKSLGIDMYIDDCHVKNYDGKIIRKI